MAGPLIADAPKGASVTLELREEQLVAHKNLRDLGEIDVRTEIDEVPGCLENRRLSRRGAG